jgi:DNA-binding CsgD family transcriptional regulator
MRPSQTKEVPVYAQKRTFKSAVAVQALHQLNAGVIVTDSCVEVVDVNAAAELIVQLQDGLLIQNDKLRARRAFETTKLAKLVAGVTGFDRQGPAAGRMLVGRCNGRSPYVLTIAPLRIGTVVNDSRLALIVVVDPEQQSPSQKDLAELFGLSPAEALLAAMLLTGKTLSQIGVSAGVQITTLRTQLRSVLRKVGARRQSDLMRILSSTGIGSLSFLIEWLDASLDALQIPLSLAGI